MKALGVRMNFLRNQNGMSMISVLMAAAAVGGIALVVAQLGKNSSQINRESQMNNDINEVFNRVQKYMLNRESCAATLTQFTSIPINPTLEQSFGTGKSIKTKIGPGAAIPQISVGDQVGTIFVEDIAFVRKTASELDLVITFDKDRSPTKERLIKKRIELQGGFSPTNINVPIKCFSQLDNAIASSCEAVGGAINGSGDCVLTGETVGEIVDRGLGEAYNKTPLYSVDGVLTANTPTNYKSRCTVSNKRCRRTSRQTCTPSCRAGFTRGSAASGRYDVRESAVNKKCCRDYWCVPAPSIGFMLQPK